MIEYRVQICAQRVLPHLKENHSKSNTLNGIQDTKPEPQRETEVRTRRARPRDVERQRRRSPQGLSKMPSTSRMDGHA